MLRAIFFLFKKDVDDCSFKLGHFCIKCIIVLRTYSIATESMKTDGAKKHLIINRSGYRYILRIWI